jgi:hypothetical protein
MAAWDDPIGYQRSLEMEIHRLRTGIREVIDARCRGDFTAILPKLRALLEDQ